MIFKQWRDVILQRKTQTRRFQDNNTYQVGKTYAVVPKRGQGAIWWSPDNTLGAYEHGYVLFAHETGDPALGTTIEQFKQRFGANWKKEMSHPAWKWFEARVEILSKRREYLYCITDEDAKAEGVANIEEYRNLWNSINTRKGLRWDDNPMVTVYTFKLVLPDTVDWINK